MNLQCAAILELLAGEDETLLVWWDALLVLDLGLDSINGVASLNLEGDGLASQSLYEDLHSDSRSMVNGARESFWQLGYKDPGINTLVKPNCIHINKMQWAVDGTQEKSMAP